MKHRVFLANLELLAGRERPSGQSSSSISTLIAVYNLVLLFSSVSSILALYKATAQS